MSQKTPHISGSITSKTHLPLVSKMQAAKKASYSFDVKPLAARRHISVFSRSISESEAAMMSALSSKEGRAVAGGCAELRFRGVTMVHFPVK